MIKPQHLFSRHLLHSVIPAKAGIQFNLKLASLARKWVPAFARMTA